MASRTEFERLWRSWKTAWANEQAFVAVLRHKYHWSDYPINQTNRTERARLERLEERERAVYKKCMGWLDAHSPRSWHSLVPVWSICEQLTFEDAVTDGPLSVVPPPAYGCSQRELEGFAKGAEGPATAHGGLR